jgi:HK97 family phage prohead protease
MEKRSMTPQVEGKKIRLQIPYNSVSTDMGFREVIAPGAFRRTLSDPHAEVLAFWNHDSSMVLGRRSAGTLDLDDDDEGLWAEIQDDRTSWCADARAAVRSRNVQGASFGFMVVDDEWDRSGGEWVRTLRDVDLLEVSPTALPAYDESQASVS